MRTLCKLAATSAALLNFAVTAQVRTHLATPNPSTSISGGPVSTKATPAYKASSVTGTVTIGIKLSDPPLVTAVGANAKQLGIKMTAAQQQAYLAQLKAKQDVVMSQVKALGGVELGRVSKGHNALIVSINAKQVPVLKNISGVIAVRPVTDPPLSVTPQPDLPTTVNYVGGVTVQNNGFKGQGVRVAMLDTGIDYTHYNLGGSGIVADYNAAVAVASGTPPSNLFPTSKVIGGYDFVGDVWPNTPALQPDPNPIDINGHGSHTADIVGGHSNDNVHFGMAPSSQLYAVKVCSSVSSSCSGVAILEGIDFALDPNNTGTLNNAVDIISMSIGESWGQREADDCEAFTEVVNFGVVAVISAGNDGDIPYILAGPASTPEVIALAATDSVVSFGIPLVINSPASIQGTYGNTATLDFAPVNSTVTANVAFVGRGCPAGSISTGSPADPYAVNPNGLIALIDRGSCSVSLKIDAAARAGAVGVLIGLVAPGDAVSFSNGGGSDFVPSLVITQATSNLIKNTLTNTGPVNATISPNNAIPTSGNIASFSSRGPNYSYNMLKPDMSAPGTITAAQPGTGNGQTTESGTSFACPMTAGAAALLLSKNHTLTPLDVKAILMETTEPAVYNNALTQPGVLAPMSRMGSGELRADRMAAASTSVWDASDPLAVSLSFGTYRLNANQSFNKKVVIRNYSGTGRTYQVSNTYRDAPNMTGVTLNFPPSITVAANGAASFSVSATVTPSALPLWTLNGGSQGGNGELLNTVEYAGYLSFTDAVNGENVHIPWHILPHKAANVMPNTNSLALGGAPQLLQLLNTTGAVGGLVDIFSLTGTEVQFPSLTPPGSDLVIINLQAAGVRLVCLSNCDTTPVYGVQFAITTYGQRSHPDVPAEFDVLIDLNNDGTPDLDVFNADFGTLQGLAATGQNAVWVADLTTGIATAYFYTVADLDSANVIYTAPLSGLKTSTGLQMTINSPFKFTVNAFDNYFTGFLTDSIGPMQYELDSPTVFPIPADVTVPAGSSSLVTVFPTSPYNGNSPSQTGLLLMYTDGKAGTEASQVTVFP